MHIISLVIENVVQLMIDHIDDTRLLLEILSQMQTVSLVMFLKSCYALKVLDIQWQSWYDVLIYVL